jgi:septum formation protein
MMPLILASASPRRSQLLRSAGIEFVVLPAHVNELDAEHLTPHETAQINAHRKARALAKRHPDALVLGADTVVCVGSRQFGKPANLADARRFLGELQGRTHEVVTGVCLLRQRRHEECLFAVSTLVTLRRLTPVAIRDYLSLANPLDKAGAYGIQEHGHLIVEALDGSYSNVVGLPVNEVLAVLEGWPAQAPGAHR